MLGLGQALVGLRLAMGGLSGRGVGPDIGLGRYSPNVPHNVNRGAPTRIATKHYDARIPAKQGEKGEAYSIQVLGAPDQPGKSKVPYYKVYSDYRKVAEHALDREDVPGPYRKRVKTYFESLKPESQ